MNIYNTNNVYIESKSLEGQILFISSPLTITISIITLVILLFIFIPKEWLSMANILALIIFNT